MIGERVGSAGIGAPFGVNNVMQWKGVAQSIDGRYAREAEVARDLFLRALAANKHVFAMKFSHAFQGTVSEDDLRRQK